MLEGSQVREKLEKLGEQVHKTTCSKEKVNLEQTKPPEWEEGQPSVARLPSDFPVVIQHMTTNDVEQGYDEKRWYPIEMI